MATVDNGGQILTVDYKMPGRAQVINRLLKDIVQAGVYVVPQLTKISDTEVQIAPFTALIKDSSADVVVRLETTSNASASIEPTTPYIVARLTWVNVESNYADFIPVAQVDILDDDIVLGKGNFTGSTLNDFDYSEVTYPSVLKRDTDGVNQIIGDTEIEGSLDVSGSSTFKDDMILNHPSLNKDVNFYNYFVENHDFFRHLASQIYRTLESPNPEDSGRFGYSVSLDGNNILIGAYGEDGGGILNSGKVYLFDTNGNLLQTLGSPNPENSGRFGSSVSLDGNNILIGAYGEDGGGILNSGRAYYNKIPYTIN